MSTKPPLMTATALAPDFNAPDSILDLLNLALYEIIGISGSLVTRICESEYGITREEWQLMAMLADLGPMSPSEIAERTAIDRSQVSKTLAGLGAKKLVVRQRVAGDARRVQLQISGKGIALYQNLFPRVVRVHHSLLQGFTKSDRKRLAEDLLRIKQNAIRTDQALSPTTTAPRSRGGSRIRWQI